MNVSCVIALCIQQQKVALCITLSIYPLTLVKLIFELIVRRKTKLGGKYQSKIIRPCDWNFETKVIIVYDSFFRKPISIVKCLFLPLL